MKFVVVCWDMSSELSLESGQIVGQDHHDVIVVMDEVTEIELAPEVSGAILSANRGFSAPVRIEQDLSIEDRLKLVTLETDAFAKWEALQTVARSTLLTMASELAAGTRPDLPVQLLDAQAEAVRQTFETDPAFAAQLMTLPGVGELFMEMKPGDPAAIYSAELIVE